MQELTKNAVLAVTATLNASRAAAGPTAMTTRARAGGHDDHKPLRTRECMTYYLSCSTHVSILSMVTFLSC